MARKRSEILYWEMESDELVNQTWEIHDFCSSEALFEAPDKAVSLSFRLADKPRARVPSHKLFPDGSS